MMGARIARDPALAITVAALWALLALFVIYPLVMLGATAFVDEGRPALGPLMSVIQKPQTQRAFINSLLLGTLVGVIGTALGFLFAFTVSRANLKPGWVRVIDAMTLLPLISPPFTTSIAFIFSFGPRGLITYELFGIRGANVYGLSSTLAAEVLTYFPIAYLALRPVLAAIGGNLEEMAFSLGSSRAPFPRPGAAADAAAAVAAAAAVRDLSAADAGRHRVPAGRPACAQSFARRAGEARYTARVPQLAAAWNARRRHRNRIGLPVRLHGEPGQSRAGLGARD